MANLMLGLLIAVVAYVRAMSDEDGEGDSDEDESPIVKSPAQPDESACSAGTYLPADGSSCADCAAGQFSTARATSCTPCATGLWSLPRSSSCTVCAKGKTRISGTRGTPVPVCSDCARGKYKESAGTSL